MVFKFTIDDVLNKYIPGLFLHKFPAPVRRLLGNHTPKPVADYWIWLEILVSSFAGIALLEGVFKSSHTVFYSHSAPMIIASYGATAILCFNASAAPLAQPRSIFVGHFISSLVGVCIEKLFLLSQMGRDNYWASGALSVGVASVLMSIFNCVHPPAGASALLPSVDEQIRQMSWWYLPAQLVSSVLIISVACITGNIFRKFPAYWWTAVKKELPVVEEESVKLETKYETVAFVPGLTAIEIEPNSIRVPESINLSELELEWLEVLQNKLSGSV